MDFGSKWVPRRGPRLGPQPGPGGSLLREFVPLGALGNLFCSRFVFYPGERKMRSYHITRAAFGGLMISKSRSVGVPWQGLSKNL